jgi:hypothetical protein
MSRAFVWVLIRQAAIVIAGAATLLAIPRPMAHMPAIAMICVLTVAAFVVSMLAQRYTYLISDRGIFLTNLSQDPRLFRQTLILWSEDTLKAFRRWEENDEGQMEITVESAGKTRTVLLQFSPDDAGRMEQELEPLLKAMLARTAK